MERKKSLKPIQSAFRNPALNQCSLRSLLFEGTFCFFLLVLILHSLCTEIVSCQWSSTTSETDDNNWSISISGGKQLFSSAVHLSLRLIYFTCWSVELKELCSRKGFKYWITREVFFLYMVLCLLCLVSSLSPAPPPSNIIHLSLWLLSRTTLWQSCSHMVGWFGFLKSEPPPTLNKLSDL